MQIPNGAPETKATKNEAAKHRLTSTLSTLLRGYYFWFFLFVFLGTSSVALPGLAAMGIWPPHFNQFLSGGGALAATLFAFLKPHSFTTGYDGAVQLMRKTLLSFELGQCTDEQIVEAYAEAMEMTTFKYQNIISSDSTEAERRKAPAKQA
jgi:hypothetical protein